MSIGDLRLTGTSMVFVPCSLLRKNRRWYRNLGCMYEPQRHDCYRVACFLGNPMAGSRVYKVLISVLCILTRLQRAPTNTIIHVVLSESRKFQQLDPQDCRTGQSE